MRFCLAILTHEPLAYDTVSTTSTVGGRTLRALCMELFWQSLAAQHVTIEHQYLAAVLNIDGLRHPLLANLPFARAESGEIEISAEILPSAQMQASLSLNWAFTLFWLGQVLHSVSIVSY